jgi:hypothetical protein
MEIYQSKGVPRLKEGQYYITQAEVWTGKILTLEGKRRDARSGAPYILVFDGIAEAEQYAEKKVTESPDVECHIVDHDGKMLKRVVKSGHKRDVKKPSQWWKFWR